MMNQGAIPGFRLNGESGPAHFVLLAPPARAEQAILSEQLLLPHCPFRPHPIHSVNRRQTEGR
jgi:hypothetical protein